MTVSELIEKLKTYPQDMRVVVHGYEGGYGDVECLDTKKVILNYNKEWYLGKHESVDVLTDSGFSDFKRENSVEVLCLKLIK